MILAMYSLYVCYDIVGCPLLKGNIRSSWNKYFSIFHIFSVDINFKIPYIILYEITPTL